MHFGYTLEQVRAEFALYVGVIGHILGVPGKSDRTGLCTSNQIQEHLVDLDQLCASSYLQSRCLAWSRRAARER